MHFSHNRLSQRHENSLKTYLFPIPYLVIDAVCVPQNLPSWAFTATRKPDLVKNFVVQSTHLAEYPFSWNVWKERRSAMVWHRLQPKKRCTLHLPLFSAFLVQDLKGTALQKGEQGIRTGPISSRSRHTQTQALFHSFYVQIFSK